MKIQLITVAVPHHRSSDRSYAAQAAARSLPGSYVMADTVIDTDVFNADVIDEGPELPMSTTDAESLLDEMGMISVVIAVPHEELYPPPYVLGTDAIDRLYESYHDHAFDFGAPAAASASIVAADDRNVFLLYTTNIAEYL